jgi:alpha-amylase/alpha-mannosidase (GH57 family)
MELWHLTDDTPRVPWRVSAGETVRLVIGTWPIAPGQSVWVTTYHSTSGGSQCVDARWERNSSRNSYWTAVLGPFADGGEVVYEIRGRDAEVERSLAPCRFRVGPKLHLALMWHMHQPAYGRNSAPYAMPWVRLHALRDYYTMAALVAEQPLVRTTFNLTPILLAQLEAYARGTATDRALELVRTDAVVLSGSERDELLATFFDASWHHQIFVHERYRELFEMQTNGRPFTVQDLRDLQAWFHLAWFSAPFRDGTVELVTGEHASVQRLVAKQRDFTARDIAELLDHQQRVLRAIVPLYRALRDRGQIEVATSPYYHPIVPLVIDTDEATIDRPGGSHPRRFAWPQDASLQIDRAVDAYRDAFGAPPDGMWPSEGALSQRSLPLYARAGIRWIASDRGVLARSGRWGYPVYDPEVGTRAWRAVEGDAQIAVFFRDTDLSDAIGFRYGSWGDAEVAAADFVAKLRRWLVEPTDAVGDRIVTVILDGENAWGGYPNDGVRFLRALYRQLAEHDHEIRTVTFRGWLDGDPARGIAAHPVASLSRVHDLFTGSWIDEAGSAPGVDLGTWIGEHEENRAWELLGAARTRVAARGEPAGAIEAILAAEGSDWFWWYGDDQHTEHEPLFDELFRGHLAAAYRACGDTPPAELTEPLIAPELVWTFTHPLAAVPPGARLAIRTHCPGILRWRVDDHPETEASLAPVGGVMAGTSCYQKTLGPFTADMRRLHFSFECRHVACPGGVCCIPGGRELEIAGPMIGRARHA